MDSQAGTSTPGTQGKTAIKQNTATFDWVVFSVQMEEDSNADLSQLVANCPFTITDQADEKGFTLIHHAVLGGVEGKVLALIQLAKLC